ncbi:hypothetical protein CDAR_436811 [Caerostris darwini]|uniref:Uncharacterized protein n=1 Tax=Caerostris darwini TaxID=1538125 RepID=A0AAV4N0G0_9ARAC|nr:hypothetical protein CDAR_436811 [Caerostris darwini]
MFHRKSVVTLSSNIFCEKCVPTETELDIGKLKFFVNIFKSGFSRLVFPETLDEIIVLRPGFLLYKNGDLYPNYNLFYNIISTCNEFTVSEIKTELIADSSKSYLAQPPAQSLRDFQ